ncbi:hypothetical protein EMIT0158MI4_160129 [Burkholderia ambifaria]
MCNAEGAEVQAATGCLRTASLGHSTAPRRPSVNRTGRFCLHVATCYMVLDRWLCRSRPYCFPSDRRALDYMVKVSDIQIARETYIAANSADFSWSRRRMTSAPKFVR